MTKPTRSESWVRVRVWGSPYGIICQWLHKLLNTRHPRSLFIVAQNDVLDLVLYVSGIPLQKCLHPSETEVGPSLFK